MKTTKVVIIGGGTAGTTCAFELRKLNKDIEIIILEESQYTQYSPCALPYVLSGEIKTFDNIFIFKKEDYTSNNIILNLNSKVIEIDKINKHIIYNKDNKKQKISYDKLIISTGSYTVIPKIKGIENSNYFLLKDIKDAKEIANNIKPKSKSVIIGAGLIGIELAISLSKKGEKVDLVESQENILSSIFDNDMSNKLQENIQNNNLKIHTNAIIKEIKKDKILLSDMEIKFDKLFLCTGVKSENKLAKKTKLDTNNGIIVNEYMQTSNKDIFACGDCVESIEFNTKDKIISALGTTAVRQAKIIAQNIIKKKNKFPAVMNNIVTKIDNIFIAIVGITTKKANERNIQHVCATYTGNVRAHYYSLKEKISIKLICNNKGIIIGGQIIGHNEVVGRINLIALAIQKKCHIKELIELETCYNPASSPIFDPISITAQICYKKLSFLNKK
ncbi:MAG: FAD-dependent oxidoreductase [Nanoarchaeota archaeon]